jgi:hypothetical protein
MYFLFRKEIVLKDHQASFIVGYQERESVRYERTNAAPGYGAE